MKIHKSSVFSHQLSAKKGPIHFAFSAVFISLMSKSQAWLISQIPPTSQALPKLTQSGFIRLTKKTLVTYLITFLVFSGTGLFYLFNPFGTKSAEAAWFNDNWAYRKAITISNSSDYSFRYVHLNIDTTDAPEKFQADCGDIRFTSINGDILDYYYNTGADQCDNAGTDFYVEIPQIINGDTTFYMYYGNPAAQNGYLPDDFFGADVVVDSTSFGSEQKAPSPVAYWKFDDAQGTNAQDSTTNNNDGTLAASTATPTWQTEDQCISVKCLFFDGTDDKVTVANTIGEVQSVGFWVKPNAFTSTTPLFDLNGTAKIVTNSSGVISATGFTSPTIYVNGVVGTTISSNTWSYVMVTTGTGLSASAIKLATDNTNFMKGFIDEVRVYNQALTAAQVLANYNARSNPEGIASALGRNTQNMPNALSHGLIGYWKMDETTWTNNCSTASVVDSSGNGKNAKSCPNSTGPTGGASGKFANAGTLSGSNYIDTDYTIPVSSGITYSSWVKTSTGGWYILGNLYFNGIGFIGNISGQNFATFRYRSGSNSEVQLNGATTNIKDSNWHHIVGVASPNGGSLYVDGKLEASSTTAFAMTSSEIYIGTQDGSTNFFTGTIDESRVYNRALSPAEVGQLYTWSPPPVGYWKLDEGSGTSAVDSSGSGINATISNGTYSNGQYGKALTFNGTSTSITATNGSAGSSLLEPNGRAYSVGAWVKTTSTATKLPVVDLSNSSLNDDQDRILLSLGTTAGGNEGKPSCELSVSTTGTTFTSATAVNDGKWHYLMCTRDDSQTERGKLYVDGVLSATSSSITGSTINGFNSMLIGKDYQGTPNYFSGQIDDIRFYTYERTQAQVIQDMNAGHPAPGSPVGTPVGHWKFDEGADNMCSGGTNDVCNNGSTGNTYDGTSTATRTKLGKFNGALDFDGSDDVVTITNNTAIDMDGNLATFTFGTWINPDSDGESDTGQIFNKGSSTYLRVDSQSGSNLDLECNLDRATTDTNVNVSTAFAISGWNHVACSWNGSTLSVYVNGVLKGSSSSGTGAIASDANNLLIGGGTSNNFDGKIDEFKIYSQALTADQIKLEMNRGASQILGAVSAASNTQPNSAANEYCPPDSASTVCTSPVTEWKLDEKSGTTANDTSGNGKSGTLTNTPVWINGKQNAALDFTNTVAGSSSNKHISFGDINSFDGASAVSLSMWIYMDNKPTGFELESVMKKDFSWNPLQIAGDSEAYPGFRTALFLPGTNVINDNDLANWQTKRWYHFAMTWESGDYVRFYRDGVNYFTSGSTYTGTISDSGDSLVMGAGGASSEGFDGKLDSVRIYTYERTPAQIAWEYNKGAPIAHYRIDECQGTTINDSSGNGNTGTLTIGASGSNTTVGTCTTSGAWFDGLTGKRNYALDFDGTDDYVNTGDTIKMEGTLTISSWVYLNSTSIANVVRPIVAKGLWGGDGNGDAALGLYASGGTPFTFTLQTSGSRYNLSDTSNPATGRWYFVAATFDGSTMRLYVDGVLKNSSATSGTLTNNSSDTYIGAYPNNVSDTALNGLIDDVKIFNYPLSQTQIKTLFNDGSTRFGPSTGAP